MAIFTAHARHAAHAGNPATHGSRSLGTGARKLAAWLTSFLLSFSLSGCGSGGDPSASSPPPTTPTTFPAPPPGPDLVLTGAQVDGIVKAAAASVNDETLVIAVVDRQGDVLALYQKPMAAANSTYFGQTVDSPNLAVGLARAAALFSVDQTPLSTRSLRFLGEIHFPPGVTNAGNGDLYSIESSNRGCLAQTVTFNPGVVLPPPYALPPFPAKTPGFGIVIGKNDVMDSDPAAVNPGGVPIFITTAAGNVYMVGAVGVVSSNATDPLDVAEFASFSGAFSPGFGRTIPFPGEVLIGGVALPFVTNTTRPAGFAAGAADGTYLAGFDPTMNFPAGLQPPSEGYLVGPVAGSLLSQAQVEEIISAGITTASQTRSAIRLPQGARTQMSFAISDLDGTILGLYRMRDATIESVDVAATLSRNEVYFNGGWKNSPVVAGDLPSLPAGTAITNSAINFMGQPLFPPGIDGSPVGPLFFLYVNDVATIFSHKCLQASQPAIANQSGLTFLAAGGVGIYDPSSGQLLGGLGVRGDGADRDDFVANGAASGFVNPVPTCSGTNCYLPQPSIRSDQFCINAAGQQLPCGSTGAVRLPFSKFPRNPTD